MLLCEVEEIRVPTESPNDDSVVVVEWRVKNGAAVKAGDLVVTIETSKTTFEIEAPSDGYLFYRLEAGTQVDVGAVLAVITNEEVFSFESYEELRNSRRENDTKDAGPPVIPIGTRFSKSALRLIEEHDINSAVFNDREMVTERDVLTLIEDVTKRESADTVSLPVESAGQKLLILGGGGHSKMCIDIINQMKIFEIVGIVDQSLEKGSNVLGIPVIGRHEDLKKMYDSGVRMAINGVGAATNPVTRQLVYRELREKGFLIPNIIHPRASIEPSVKMGEGNQVMAGAVVGSDARLHSNCVVNAGAIVSHDCVLHDSAHVAPGAVLAGNVTVGRDALVGMGSTIYLGVTIGSNVTIYNGCNVTTNVPDNTTLRNGQSGADGCRLDRT